MLLQRLHEGEKTVGLRSEGGGELTTARPQTHLKLLPEALLDFVGGLGQFAQLPHSTLDFGGVDARRVQRLVGGNKAKQSFQVRF